LAKPSKLAKKNIEVPTKRTRFSSVSSKEKNVLRRQNFSLLPFGAPQLLRAYLFLIFFAECFLLCFPENFDQKFCSVFMFAFATKM